MCNSRYHAKTKFHNYFTIHLRFIPTLYKFNYFNKMLELLLILYLKNVSLVAGVSTLFVDVTS